MLKVMFRTQMKVFTISSLGCGGAQAPTAVLVHSVAVGADCWNGNAAVPKDLHLHQSSGIGT